MSFIPYKSSIRRLFVPFTLPVFLLLTFQPLTKTTADNDAQPVAVPRLLAVAALAERPKSGPTNTLPGLLPQIRIPVRNTSRKDQDSKLEKVLSELAKAGPEFATAYSLSNFGMKALMKGGWPLGIGYQLEGNSTAEVTISSGDGKLKFPISLKPTNGELGEVKVNIPEAFGTTPQVGLISFKALKNGPEPRKPADFFLVYLGAGPAGVHSAVLVKLDFKPTTIRPKLKEKASYSFQSLSDFNSVAVDLNLAVRAPDGSTHPQLAYRKELKNGVRSGQTVAGDWDGKNSKGKISVGAHQLHVRAWRGLQSGADWAFAAERILVKVEKE